MTEEVTETIVETVKDQLAKTVLGAIAGFGAAKLTDKLYDLAKAAIKSKAV